MTDIPDGFMKDVTALTGVLKVGPKVKSIGDHAFRGTKLTGLDLSGATALETIGDYAFRDTLITGAILIPTSVDVGSDAFPKSVTWTIG